MGKDNSNRKLQILDIYCASYLTYKGILPNLITQGTRVIFEFPATDEVYRLLSEYNENPDTPILDYVATLRKLRAIMLSRRNENGNRQENNLRETR